MDKIGDSDSSGNPEKPIAPLKDKTDALTSLLNSVDQNKSDNRRCFLKKIRNIGILSLSGAWLIKNVSAGEISQSPQRSNDKSGQADVNLNVQDDESCATSKRCGDEQICGQACVPACSNCFCPVCRCDISLGTKGERYSTTSSDSACATVWADHYIGRYPSKFTNNYNKNSK